MLIYMLTIGRKKNENIRTDVLFCLIYELITACIMELEKI